MVGGRHQSIVLIGELAMKIVLAPDSFKESLRAIDVASALETGIRRVLPDVQCVKVPMADGGEGTVDALVSAKGGHRINTTVVGPLGEPVQAAYGLLDDRKTAVIEIAAAAGVQLVPVNRRNPLNTISFGVGELIRDALERGARRIIVGIGGSATNDGGIGMAQALGIRFLDKASAALENGAAGEALGRVSKIDIEARMRLVTETEIQVACDVDNPLVGKSGASAIYAPQKGATPDQVLELERNLRHFGTVIEHDLGIEVLNRSRGGAAGGLGAGLLAFAGAQLLGGAELVADAVGLKTHLSDADLVITGEGSIDSQTGSGKTPFGVAAIARLLEVPVVAVGGGLADDAHSVFAHGIDALVSATVRPMSRQDAIENSQINLCNAGERIAKWLVLGRNLSRS